MNGSYLLRSTLSWSATHCRSWAGRCWLCQASPGAGSGTAALSACGWRRSAGTGSAGAACPARRFCCTQTTLLYPSWSAKKKRISLFHKEFSNTDLNRIEMTWSLCWSRILENHTSVSVQQSLRRHHHTLVYTAFLQRLLIMSMDTDCTIHGLKTYCKCYSSLSQPLGF